MKQFYGNFSRKNTRHGKSTSSPAEFALKIYIFSVNFQIEKLGK